MSTSSASRTGTSPADFLKRIKGKPVVVKLNSGVDYRGIKSEIWSVDFGRFLGILSCLDGYMNIAMGETEEYVNGQLKCKYGDCFIRGNNGNSLYLNSSLIEFVSALH